MRNSANKNQSVSHVMMLITVLLNAVILKHAFIHNPMWYWALLFTLPLLFMNIFITKHKFRNRISLKNASQTKQKI